MTIWTLLQKIELEAKGYPRLCNWEQKRYVEDIFEREDITLDLNKIKYNLGQCAILNLILNSLWGRFAQSSNLVKTSLIQDPQLSCFVTWPLTRSTCSNADLLNDEIIKIGHEYTNNFIQMDAKRGNRIHPCPFTTLGVHRARYVETMPDVLWHRLDILPHQTWEPKLQLGNYVGDNITIFVSDWPKNHCYKTNTGKVETKVCGIMLDCKMQQKVNFNVIHALAFPLSRMHVAGGRSWSITYSESEKKTPKQKKSKPNAWKSYCIAFYKCVIMVDYKA